MVRPIDKNVLLAVSTKLFDSKSSFAKQIHALDEQQYSGGALLRLNTMCLAPNKSPLLDTPS